MWLGEKKKIVGRVRTGCKTVLPGGLARSYMHVDSVDSISTTRGHEVPSFCHYVASQCYCDPTCRIRASEVWTRLVVLVELSI